MSFQSKGHVSLLARFVLSSESRLEPFQDTRVSGPHSPSEHHLIQMIFYILPQTTWTPFSILHCRPFSFIWAQLRRREKLIFLSACSFHTSASLGFSRGGDRAGVGIILSSGGRCYDAPPWGIVDKEKMTNISARVPDASLCPHGSGAARGQTDTNRLWEKVIWRQVTPWWLPVIGRLSFPGGELSINTESRSTGFLRSVGNDQQSRTQI